MDSCTGRKGNWDYCHGGEGRCGAVIGFRRTGCCLILIVGIAVLCQLSSPTLANVGAPAGGQADPRDTVWVPDDYATIQAGMDACPRGGTVMVRPGVYQENLSFNGRPLSLIALEGPDSTVIEALDSSQSVIWFAADDEYVSRIEGFTITGGSFGIRCHGEHLQPYRLYIVDNVVEGNDCGMGLHAISAWVQGNTVCHNYGSGGIATIAEPMIVQNVISGNLGDEGGGITVWLEDTRPIIGGSPGMGNVITDNVGTLHPRAHDLYRQFPGELINAKYNTWTVYPPTEYVCYPLAEFDTDSGDGAPRIEQDVYVSPLGDNSNSGLNAANPLRNIHHALARLVQPTPPDIRTIFLAPGTYSLGSNLELLPILMISNVIIAGNAMDSVVVDAFNCWGGFVLEHVENVTFANLTIQNSYAQAIRSEEGQHLQFRNLNLHHNDNGLTLIGDSCVTITNCIFAWNQSGVSGAGMLLDGSYAELINSTFYRNLSGEYGGGIACFFSGELWVENCILWGNQDVLGCPDIYGSAIPVITVTYTDIEQGWTSIGNISLNPEFVDTSETHPDFHLSPGSPCIDAGNPDPTYNDPDGTRNDMGAYGGPWAAGWVGVERLDRPISLPNDLRIIALYPNPANPSAKLVYQVPQPGWVSVAIYNILGQRLKSVLHAVHLPGRYSLSLDGSGLASGIYFCRVETSAATVSRKIVILR
jgi:hypothetical protein